MCMFSITNAKNTNMGIIALKSMNYDLTNCINKVLTFVYSYII